jgi:hypothetical protein
VYEENFAKNWQHLAAGDTSDEDKKETKILPPASSTGENNNGGPAPNKYEADIKLELADYDDEENSCSNGVGSVPGSSLKLFQPKCELSEDQQNLPFPATWHWNRIPAAAAAAAAALAAGSSSKRGGKRGRKKGGGEGWSRVKEEEEGEGEEWQQKVRKKKKKKKVAGGTHSALPKAKLVEYHQVRT